MNKITKQNQTNEEFSVKNGLLIAVVGIVFVVSIFALNSALPVELRAKRYAFGVVSRIDLFGWAVLAFSLIMLATKNYIRSLVGIVMGAVILSWSYHFAFELAKGYSPETFSKYTSLEIGCFPDKWHFMIEKYDLSMWDEAILCSEKDNKTSG